MDVISDLGRERLLEWSVLILRTAEGENEDLGVITWVISALQEPVTTSTILAQLTTTSDLNEVADILGANTYYVRAPAKTNSMERGPMSGDEHVGVVTMKG